MTRFATLVLAGCALWSYSHREPPSVNVWEGGSNDGNGKVATGLVSSGEEESGVITVIIELPDVISYVDCYPPPEPED